MHFFIVIIATVVPLLADVHLMIFSKCNSLVVLDSWMACDTLTRKRGKMGMKISSNRRLETEKVSCLLKGGGGCPRVCMRVVVIFLGDKGGRDKAEEERMKTKNKE